ncbi:hypothetical protein ACJJTC_001651 [Scirpophaga incertulas]
MAFYSCGRQGIKSLLSNTTKLSGMQGILNHAQFASAVPKITYKKFESTKEEHYDIRNENLKRPMSPHLTIYSPQLTSMLSITHRTAGLILSGYVSALGIGALVLPNDISHYITMIEGLNLSPATLFLLKAVIAAPLGYHFANGIRHLYWDTAKGLTLKEVYATGYTMLAVALVSTFIMAAL